MHRQFRDAAGRAWQVWEVIPQLGEGREAVTGNGRRAGTGARAPLPDELRGGWLAFESHRERRRLAPIPAGWQGLSDRELAELVARATDAGRTRRLIE